MFFNSNFHFRYSSIFLPNNIFYLTTFAEADQRHEQGLEHNSMADAPFRACVKHPRRLTEAERQVKTQSFATPRTKANRPREKSQANAAKKDEREK
ncbi:MAG: hypothetical protein CMJ80_08605 [Planctomycetaceae bacterium]|nr:hypothetical protein [Planctomycetaceae bacterium]